MADRVIFVCIIIFAAVYFYATSQISTLQIGVPLGPKAFPYLLGIGLLIAAGLLLTEILQARRTQALHEAAVKERADWRHLLLIGAVIVWTTAYFAVFEWLGYMISTAIYLFVLMAYYNRGKWIANTLTAVLFAIGSYVLFNEILGVSLPGGLLKF